MADISTKPAAGAKKRAHGAYDTTKGKQRESDDEGHTSNETDHVYTIKDPDRDPILADLEDAIGSSPTMDASGHVYGHRRRACCGYPTTKDCMAGTFISFKFWAALASVLFVFITLLVIDAKLNRSIYMTQALAYWNMNEVDKLENLTHDCVCIQWMCQENANGTKLVHTNPITEGQVGTHKAAK